LKKKFKKIPLLITKQQPKRNKNSVNIIIFELFDADLTHC
jgi:hypothetical protein